MKLLSLEEDENISFTNCEIQGSDDCDIRIPENAMALEFTMGGTLAQPELLTMNSWRDIFVDMFVVQPMTGML